VNALNRKLLVTQIITHVIIILVIVVLTIVFSPGNFESKFIGQWYLSSSIVYYLQYLIPITATGLLITFSIQTRPEDLGAGASFFKLIQGALIYLIVIMIAYTLLLLLLLPWAYQQQSDAEFRSDFVNRRIEQAIGYLEEEDYRRAGEMVDDVLSLVPQHDAGVRLFWEIQERMPPTPQRETEEPDTPRIPLDLSYGEILDRAKQYYADQDWYSAVFYARLALGPNEERRDDDARQILSESLKAISRLEPGAEESAERRIFQLKQDGVGAWNANEYLDAYYIFKELEALRPSDRDVQTYLAYLLPEVENVAFFLDEIDAANREDIRRQVFFRVPDVAALTGTGASGGGQDETAADSADPVPMRFIAAEQMMRSSRGLYFIDMEYIEVSPRGTVLTHIKVPRGKMSGSYLITRSVDRDDPRLRYDAVYLNGRPVPGEEGVLRVPMDPSDIWAVNPSSTFYNDVNILQLFSLARMYPAFGKNAAFPQSEILYRLLLPFSLINISLIVIGMAWRGRSRYISGPPAYLYIFLPLIPVFILGLFDLYVLVFRSLLSAILLLTGFPVALLTLVAIQALVFVLIMLMMARLSTE
jgi:hypothetical protein